MGGSMLRTVDAAQALADLTEISSQIVHVAIVGEDGAVLASTLDDERQSAQKERPEKANKSFGLFVCWPIGAGAKHDYVLEVDNIDGGSQDEFLISSA